MTELNFESGAMDWNRLENNLGEAAKIGKKKSYKDDRIWKLSRDENDNGGALIRLLPDSEGVPYIQMFTNTVIGFNAATKKKTYYIENSPATIDLPCPSANMWQALMDLGTEEGAEAAKLFKRKTSYITNIKVLKDPNGDQASEGKIKMWWFGKKLLEKFVAALDPSDSDIQMGETPKQLFNPLTGNSIKLKISKAAGGFLNYDSTTIADASSIYPDGEAAKKDIIENSYKLNDMLKVENFESFESLQSKLWRTMENHTVKGIDPVVFKSLLAKVCGKDLGNTAVVSAGVASASVAAAVEQDIDEIEAAVQAVEAAPVQGAAVQAAPVQAAPAVDDGLGFLDDL